MEPSGLGIVFSALRHFEKGPSMSSEMTCRKCGQKKLEEEFPLNRTGGREYRKTTCKDCDNKRRCSEGFSPALDPERDRQLMYIRTERWRANPNNRPTKIITDARKADKKKGLICDLDKEWVREQIGKECSYCGETNVLMTLDRIDNSLGHSKENVVPACMRCNYLRKDMPIEAWKVLVPAVREAREKGLFGSWNAFGVRKKKSKEYGLESNLGCAEAPLETDARPERAWG